MQIYVRLRIQSVLLRMFMRVPDDGFMKKPKHAVLFRQ